MNLARDLEHLKELAAAEQLLRAWQERYPGNFWLTHDLGWVLLHQTPPRPVEAAREPLIGCPEARQHGDELIERRPGFALLERRGEVRQPSLQRSGVTEGL